MTALVLGRTRLSVHPLTLLFPILAARLGEAADMVALAAGLVAHEGAHLAAARCLGVGVSALRLMPFGAAIEMENPYALSPGRLFAVAAAGPAASGLMALLAVASAHWGWLSPAPALAAVRINGALMLFNLLPALPLDGGRMLAALLTPRLGMARAANLGILLGRILAGALLLAAVIALIERGQLNLSPVLAAVFLIASGRDEREAVSDTRARTLLNAVKPLDRPVPVRMVAVSADCPLPRALRAARPDSLTLYAVYRDSRLSSITDDRRLLEAMLEGKDRSSVGTVQQSHL